MAVMPSSVSSSRRWTRRGVVGVHARRAHGRARGVCRRSPSALAAYDADSASAARDGEGNETTTTQAEEGAAAEVESESAAAAAAAATEVEGEASAVGTSARTELLMSALPPWSRFRRGSALQMTIAGELPETEPPPSLTALLQGGRAATRAATLPKLVRALEMAARDPRVSGVFITMGQLACGWAKLEELRRGIAAVRAAGKFTVAYAEVATMKEFYVMSACEELYVAPCAYVSLRGVAVSGSFVRGVLDKIGVEPQIQRIGKYKSAGDQLARRDMSEAQREVLGTILEDVYDNFVHAVAKDRGKTADEVRAFLDSGEFVVAKLVGQGFVTGATYLSQLRSSLAKRTSGRAFSRVGITRYLKSPPTLFASGERSTGKPGVVAVVRASGAIGRGSGGGGIQSDDFVRLLRSVRKRKEVKAVVLRIDSPGGDALASDLMWKELKSLSKEKPVIASMSDVAASGGYYMSMACKAIVAEALTLTGSIGVVTGKFNLASLYDRVGFTKETLSKGRFAEVDADERAFTDDERDYFSRSAQHAYASFRNKAAASRNMSVEKMERVAQGRVWTGTRALEEGLVDVIGGMSTAIAMAKDEGGVTGTAIVVEASPPKSPLAALRARGALVLAALASIETLVAAAADIKAVASEAERGGVQLLMEDIDIM